MKKTSISILTAFSLVSCARSSVPEVRYSNAPPVEVVDDRRDVPNPPAERELVRALYFFDGTFHRRITRALELHGRPRALGINALDEVPDSTWFTNRIGKRDLTTEELIAGPTEVGSPEPHKPWTIHSTKTTGESVGFIMSDARGERFLLKFDRRGFPEIETTAHVIVNRLLWASGYNVPEDHLVFLRPSDLRLAEDAVLEDRTGKERPMTQADLAHYLGRLEVEPDGQLRGMASLLLEGTLLGGHPSEGVRPDDPNDRIPHELRRDLRGALPIFAWLDHVDIKEDNSLDVWVTDPADPQRHYVKHYFLDFGKSLGARGTISYDPRAGHEYNVDFAKMWGSLVFLGFLPRPWENRPVPRERGVALYEAETYDPGAWKPHTPAYTPFLTADRFDRFWGAKILMRFTPEQLRALVESLRMSDPRAVDYLTNTLVARQRATARHAFLLVNPLDGFEVVQTGQGPTICFVDLLLAYGLSTDGPQTRYVVTSHDRAGRKLGTPRVVSSQGARSCSAPFTAAQARDGYTILRIETRRPGFTGSTLVHVARDPGSQAPRVIGIWRE